MGATADFTQQPQTEILLGCLSHRPVHFSMTLFPSLNHLPLLAQKSRGASRLLRLRIVRRRLTKGGRGGAAGCAKITTKYSRVPYKRVCVCVCMHGAGSASLKWNTAPPRSVPASAVRRSHEGTNKGADSVVRGSPCYNTFGLLILIR